MWQKVGRRHTVQLDVSNHSSRQDSLYQARAEQGMNRNNMTRGGWIDDDTHDSLSIGKRIMLKVLKKRVSFNQWHTKIKVQYKRMSSTTLCFISTNAQFANISYNFIKTRRQTRQWSTGEYNQKCTMCCIRRMGRRAARQGQSGVWTEGERNNGKLVHSEANHWAFTQKLRSAGRKGLYHIGLRKQNDVLYAKPPVIITKVDQDRVKCCTNSPLYILHEVSSKFQIR